MTSRACSKSCHPALGLFVHTLKRQTGITLLATAFLFLICPGILWRNIKNSWENIYEFNEALPMWSMVIFFGALILGVILLCFNHGHLFSKKTADLYYALPVKRDILLVIRFGSSFIGAVFAMTVSFAGLSCLAFVEGAAVSELCRLYFLTFLQLLLCLSTVLIFVVNAGSIFNFLFSAMVVCVGIPVMCLIGYYWYCDRAYGVVSEGMWLQYISPFGYAACQFALFGEGNDFAPLWVSIAGILLFLTISFLLHHYRRTETAGGKYAFSIAALIITTLASGVGGYLIGLLFSEGDVGEDGFWFFCVVGAALTALASGAIISKGFHSIRKWLLCAAVAVALLVVIGVTAQNRAQKDTAYVPALEDIASITLEEDYNHPKVVFTSDFELFTELHSHMIDIYMGTKDRMPNQYNSDILYSDLVPSEVYITYTLKDGTTVRRSYWIDDAIGLSLMLDIMQADSYAPSFVLEGEEATELYFCDYTTGESVSEILTEEETQQLLTTYARELQQTSDDALWEESAVFVQLRNGEEYLEFHVPGSFTETLALMKSLVITVIE